MQDALHRHTINIGAHVAHLTPTIVMLPAIILSHAGYGSFTEQPVPQEHLFLCSRGSCEKLQWTGPHAPTCAANICAMLSLFCCAN
eukprot:241687-Pelagomonas_calceolata.AAC.5